MKVKGFSRQSLKNVLYIKRIFLKFLENSWENIQPQRTALKFLSMSLINSFLRDWRYRCGSRAESKSLMSAVNSYSQNELNFRCCSSRRHLLSTASFKFPCKFYKFRITYYKWLFIKHKQQFTKIHKFSKINATMKLF